MSARVIRVAPDEMGRAPAGDAEWLWVVAAGVEPRPDALDRLLGAGLEAPERPVALCSLIVGTNGEPHPDFLPDGHRHRLEETIAACERRLLTIRDAPLACALLSAEAVRAVAPPDPRFGGQAGREFMARLMGGGHGYMVSASIATAAGSDPARPADRLRLLRSPTWSTAERARLLALTARDAVRAGASPARRGSTPGGR